MQDHFLHLFFWFARHGHNLTGASPQRYSGKRPAKGKGVHSDAESEGNLR